MARLRALAEARAEHGGEDGRHERKHLGQHKQLHCVYVVVVGELEDDLAIGVDVGDRIVVIRDAAIGFL